MTDVVVDTSAAIAILAGESASDELIAILDRAERRLMSTATLVELSIVMEARHGPAGSLAVDQFVRDGDVTVVEVDRTQATRAIEGWRRYGKGRHPAALNFGDCFTYALASESGLPALCVGNDFAQTDLEVLPASWV